MDTPPAFDTPVLLVVWRRPHELRQVIKAVRSVAPSRIFVACDGPNHQRLGEAEKVAATRQVIEQEIDWPCDIKRLYSDVNQGCRLGVSRAINWFFEEVEEGIILEDDCVPHPDFFTYCSIMLDRYRSDTRVWCVSGNNFLDADWSGDGDYFFSQIPMSWGWASWRSRWNFYDSDLHLWPLTKKYSVLQSLMPDSLMRSYWTSIWEKLWTRDTPDSWAYRWAFTCVVNRGLTVLPKVNLVQNVGFGVDATHTISHRLIRPTSPLETPSLTAPRLVASLHVNDIFIFDHHFGGKWMRFPLSLVKPFASLIRLFLRFFRASFQPLSSLLSSFR